MLNLLRTQSNHSDFISLVKSLDKELESRDGPENKYYSKFNTIDNLNHVILAYHNGLPSGCGAIKIYETNIIEIKRMFVLPEMRGNKIATKILNELEKWAKELKFEKCILETGKRQFEAIELYKKYGFQLRNNYGPYIGIDNSLCFEKQL